MFANKTVLKTILLVTIFVCTTLLSAAQTLSSSKPLKIVCYNLRFGELASLEELAEFIKSHNPDVVALQEVDVNTFRESVPHQNGKDFITELGYLTKMFSAYGRTINYAGGYYGIGILSRYPFAQTRRVMLPMPVGAKEQRALLLADVELPEGNIFTFVSTHLDHSTSEVRTAQVDSLNSTLKDNPWPIIVAGDFNGDPLSPEIKKGMSNWKQACNNDFTISSQEPRAKIDYIFCQPANQWKILRAETPRISLSDHLPVVAEVELVF